MRELAERLPVDDHRVETIFFGGGTPTILSTEELTFILGSLEKSVDLGSVREFTVEANPATIDDEKAKLLRSKGVTRVSMGAQSFFEAELAVLERLHCPKDIAPSVATLRRNDIAHLNLDLILGIPGQTIETWSVSLVRSIELEPDHIACYGLTYEPHTRLTAQQRDGRIIPMPESLEADMHSLTIDTLAQSGYKQYEISNFAKPGCECRHNLNYWRNGPCVSIGPSATGCLDDRRYKNVADVSEYVRLIDAHGHAEADVETIDRGMLMTEMIMMQLRLVKGLSILDFTARTGVDPLTLLKKELDHLVELGFVSIRDTHIAMTRRGQLVGNAVIAQLASACGDREAAACSDTAKRIHCVQ